MKERRKEGRQAGREEGRKELGAINGMKEMKEWGMKGWRKECKNEGMKEGRNEGIEERRTEKKENGEMREHMHQWMNLVRSWVIIFFGNVLPQFSSLATGLLFPNTLRKTMETYLNMPRLYLWYLRTCMRICRDSLACTSTCEFPWGVPTCKNRWAGRLEDPQICILTDMHIVGLCVTFPSHVPFY